MVTSMKIYILSIVVIVFIGGMIYWSNTSRQKVQVELENMSSREIALRRTTDMATEYHIHPELSIIIDDVPVVIPQNLGVDATGMTAIHTHDEKGVIHVESPVKKDFTLGDFFAVWNKDFSSSKLINMSVDKDSEIVVTVNGEQVYTYENTILRDKDKIMVSYQKK